MDQAKIKNKLRHEIEKISKKYSYLSISNHLLNSMVDDILEEVLKENGTSLNKEFNEYFLEKLDQYMKGYIGYQLMHHDDDILNQFIKYNINQKRGINELGKIGKLFQEMNYEVDISIYADMIRRNSTLNEMMKKFLKKNQKKIKQGILLDLVDESTMIFVESYCLENNIELGEQKEEDTEYLNLDIQKQYIKDVKSLDKKLLTREEEIELSNRISLKDQEARKELAEANLRLVLSIAPKFQNRGLSLEDLIQSGNEGLMKAVDRFDPKKGRFSTYAKIWIVQSILYDIYNTSRTIRLPVDLIHKIRNLKKTEAKLVDRYKRNPKICEIAKELKKSENYVHNLYRIDQDIDSLDRPYTTPQGKEFSILDLISDYHQNTENKVEQSFLSLELQELMDEANLTEAEKETLYLRYGLEMTLEEAAKVQNFSSEWVRQLQKKGIRKMRNTGRMKYFAIYMDHPDQAQKDLELLKSKGDQGLRQEKMEIHSTKEERGKIQANQTVKEESNISNSTIQIFEHYKPLEINYGPYQVSANDTKKMVKKKQ